MSKQIKILFKPNGQLYQLIFQLNYIKTICRKYEGAVDVTILISGGQMTYDLLSVNQTFATFKEGDCLGDKGEYDCVAELYWFPRVILFKEKKVKKNNPELYSLIKDWVVFSRDVRTEKMCEPGDAFLFTITQYLLAFDRKICSSLDVSNHFEIDDIAEYKLDSKATCQYYDKEKYGSGRIITISCITKSNKVRGYVKEKYEKLCGLIKQKCSDITIIQLYVSDDEKMENVDYHINGSNEAEFLAVMDRSVLHIGSEDDIIHIRRSLSHVASACFYYSMDSRVWGYDSNINLCFNTGFYLSRANMPECIIDSLDRNGSDERFSEYFANIIGYLENVDQ